MTTKTAKLPPIRVKPELRQKLEEVAAANEMSLAAVIRAACEHYVAVEEAVDRKTVKIPVIGVLTSKGIIPYRRTS